MPGRAFSIEASAGLIHVAAAVIVNRAGEVLLARRPEHVHQGGLWEFPGGKLEPAEDSRSGLARELEEELGIVPSAARPLIRIPHRYPDKSVLLDVWRVDAWRGELYGREGQTVEWVPVAQLTERAFPAANLPIVTAARLPDRYLITPQPGADQAAFLDELAESLRSGMRLVQLRVKELPYRRLRELATRAAALCHGAGASLLVNGDARLAEESGADGVHLSGARLMACSERPLPAERWVAASCHDGRELEHACRLRLDFVVLSSVKSTASHPRAQTLGWAALRRLTERATLPVYALGGMQPADLPVAWEHGAQGIAAIRSLWTAAL
ncbi:MAG: Nudix family hydrolase [Gammaproteobacteria bacterium]|nr:Nudix family hydrolase [Gammaproteobacteria bacterium]